MTTLLERIDGAVVEDKELGLFRCRRDIFTDAEMYDLEMEHIFEGNWVFLAHESQIPDNNDYFSTWIGRKPIMITRDKTGELHAMINACAHRGAMLCRRKHGNKGSFTCPFHGWTFSNTGKLLKVKDGKTGDYPASFNTHGSHDLARVPRFESYRGFLFGSLNPDVVSLEEHLGGARTVIDQIVDGAPDGIEVLRGNSSYIYDGNWKLQMENGADGYHVSSVHWNYSATMGHRNYETEGTKTVDANGWSKSIGGVYGFENGHILLWTNLLNPEVRPVFNHREELEARLGKDRAELHRRPDPQPRNLPERLPHGPVLDADPRGAADQRRPDRGHDLLLRAQGRGREGAGDPHPSVRRLLQRLRYGHAGRSRGIPRLPDRLCRRRRTLERPQPRCRPLDRRSGRERQGDRTGAASERRA